MDFDLPEDFGVDLGPAAGVRIRECVEGYARDVLDEASRLEEGQRAESGDPEITSTMIADADIHIRRGYFRQRRSNSAKATQLVAVAGAVLAGVAGSNMAKTWGPWLFVAAVVAAMGATAYNLWGES